MSEQTTEMTALVEKLAKERKQRIDHVENMTFRDLKHMQRKSYVPRLRTKEELEAECAVKKSWADPGSKNSYFQPPPIMKPKILDPWTLSRVQMPQRGYEKRFCKDQPDFGPVRTKAEEFPKCSTKTGMSAHFTEFLDKQQKEFTRWVECPSHFDKEPTEPVALQRETKVFKAGSSVEGVFGDHAHTAWEEFQKTMTTPAYRTIMQGKVFPKRNEVTDATMSFEDSLATWEKNTHSDAIKKRHQSMKMNSTKVI